MNYSDLSTGNPTSWNWEFGDDETSSLQNPWHIYQGTCEPAVKNELGNVVQFERVCFAKIDAVADAGVTAYFTHR